MRVLVTGGLGYIGRAVTIELLKADHQVSVLTRRSPELASDIPAGASVVRGDIRDADRLRNIFLDGLFDGVCHLAARSRVRESFSDPIGYYETNFCGTLNVVAAQLAAAESVDLVPRIVNASSVMVYGPSDGNVLSEARECRPSSPYGASKLAAEELLRYQAETGSLAAISLRIFSAAGALDGHGDPELSRIIPKALAVAAGRAPLFELNGDGSTVREFTHVADVADAFVRALAAARVGGHDVYNVGTGVGVTLREVLHTVEDVTGQKLNIVRRPAQKEPAATIADTARIQENLGWQPTRSAIREIIADSWDVIRGQRMAST